MATRRLHLVAAIKDGWMKCAKCDCTLIDPESQKTLDLDKWEKSPFNCHQVELPPGKAIRIDYTQGRL